MHRLPLKNIFILFFFASGIASSPTLPFSPDNTPDESSSTAATQLSIPQNLITYDLPDGIYHFSKRPSSKSDKHNSDSVEFVRNLIQPLNISDYSETKNPYPSSAPAPLHRPPPQNFPGPLTVRCYYKYLVTDWAYHHIVKTRRIMTEIWPEDNPHNLHMVNGEMIGIKYADLIIFFCNFDFDEFPRGYVYLGVDGFLEDASEYCGSRVAGSIGVRSYKYAYGRGILLPGIAFDMVGFCRHAYPWPVA